MAPRPLPHLDPQPTPDPVRYAPELRRALDHAHGTSDPVFAPETPPGVVRRSAAWWLPEGHVYDLHIEHAPLETAGKFTGGGNKLLWHITVSRWNTVDSIWRVLRDKRAAPHLVIGGRSGVQHPVVIQCIPFNRAGRALAHPSGPETNRADCVQVEICANVADVPQFDEHERYRAFANLVRLTNITVPDRREVIRKIARSFQNTNRFGGQGFVEAQGHCGHMHVPGNDHADPTTAFQGGRLMDRLDDMPAGGHQL
jgi:hypothetical protein